MAFKIKNNYIEVEPCSPKNWKEYEIKYKYKTNTYNIKVKNKNGKNTGVERVVIDGIEVKDRKIMLEDNGKFHNIEIFM